MKTILILLMFVLGLFTSNKAVMAQESGPPDNIVITLPTYDSSSSVSSTPSTTGEATITSSNLRGRLRCNVKRARCVGSTIVETTTGVVKSTRSVVNSGLTRVVSRGRSVSSRAIDVTEAVLTKGQGRVRQALSRVRGIFQR